MNPKLLANALHMKPLAECSEWRTLLLFSALPGRFGGPETQSFSTNTLGTAFSCKSSDLWRYIIGMTWISSRKVKRSLDGEIAPFIMANKLLFHHAMICLQKKVSEYLGNHEFIPFDRRIDIHGERDRLI